MFFFPQYFLFLSLDLYLLTELNGNLSDMILHFSNKEIFQQKKDQLCNCECSLSDIAIKGRGGGVIEEHCRLTLISNKFQLKNVEML